MGKVMRSKRETPPKVESGKLRRSTRATTRSVQSSSYREPQSSDSEQQQQQQSADTTPRNRVASTSSAAVGAKRDERWLRRSGRGASSSNLLLHSFSSPLAARDGLRGRRGSPSGPDHTSRDRSRSPLPRHPQSINARVRDEAQDDTMVDVGTTGKSNPFLISSDRPESPEVSPPPADQPSSRHNAGGDKVQQDEPATRPRHAASESPSLFVQPSPAPQEVTPDDGADSIGPELLETAQAAERKREQHVAAMRFDQFWTSAMHNNLCKLTELIQSTQISSEQQLIASYAAAILHMWIELAGRDSKANKLLRHKIDVFGCDELLSLDGVLSLLPAEVARDLTLRAPPTLAAYSITPWLHENMMMQFITETVYMLPGANTDPNVLLRLDLVASEQEMVDDRLSSHFTGCQGNILELRFLAAQQGFDRAAWHADTYNLLSSTSSEILFLYNPFGNHWMVVHARPSADLSVLEFHLHNSIRDSKMCENVKERLGMEARWLNELLHQASGLAVRDYEVIDSSSNFQTNSDDCGPIAIMTAIRLACGKSSRFEASGTQIRLWLLRRIFYAMITQGVTYHDEEMSIGFPDWHEPADRLTWPLDQESERSLHEIDADNNRQSGGSAADNDNEDENADCRKLPRLPEYDFVLSCYRQSDALKSLEQAHSNIVYIHLQMQVWHNDFFPQQNPPPAEIDLSQLDHHAQIPEAPIWSKLLLNRSSDNEWLAERYGMTGHMSKGLKITKQETCLRRVLVKLNEAQAPRRVAVIQSSIDGSFTSPQAWNNMLEAFPNIHFDLFIAMRWDRIPRDVRRYWMKSNVARCHWNLFDVHRLNELSSNAYQSQESTPAHGDHNLQRLIEMTHAAQAWKQSCRAGATRTRRPDFLAERGGLIQDKAKHSVDKTYADSGGLALHTVTKHPKDSRGLPQHVCNNCGNRHPTQAALTAHEEGCKPRVRYVCERCSKSYSTQDALTKHRRGAHPEGGGPPVRYVCKCGKSYSTQAYLTVHRRDAHPEGGGPPVRYVCKCGKSYITQDALTRHRRDTHPEGGGPPIRYVCECGRSYADSYKLTIHRRTCRDNCSLYPSN